jgi:hypothetical protein
MTTTRCGVALAALAVMLSASATAPARSQRARDARSFLSPSGNIGCELDWQRGTTIPNRAYCQTYHPPRAVTMSPNGALRVCTGSCIGDPGEDAFTLGYGRRVKLGPFRCQSLTSGMRCTVASGRGFLLSRAGVRRF